jgi:hypothetical protein
MGFSWFAEVWRRLGGEGEGLSPKPELFTNAGISCDHGYNGSDNSAKNGRIQRVVLDEVGSEDYKRAARFDSQHRPE